MKSLLILLFYLCSTAIHAFAQYEQALLKQLSDTGDDSVRFYIYRGLGYIYEFDDSAKSNEYYREEQKIAESLSSPLLKSMVLVDLGSVLYNAGDFEAALFHFKESLKWATLTKECKRMNVALQNIANSYFSAYLLDSTAYYGIQSIESSTLCKDTATLILTCANLNIY